jgi:hypothetical protein
MAGAAAGRVTTPTLDVDSKSPFFPVPPYWPIMICTYLHAIRHIYPSSAVGLSETSPQAQLEKG